MEENSKVNNLEKVIVRGKEIVDGLSASQIDELKPFLDATNTFDEKKELTEIARKMVIIDELGKTELSGDELFAAMKTEAIKNDEARADLAFSR